jgi:hypothetical protein
MITRVRSSVLLAGFVFCLISSLASANSVGIPISGTAIMGFASTYGDFDITGPGLVLQQGLPEGPSSLGPCRAGGVCNFSFTIDASGASFCAYCLYLDSGNLGNKVVELLVPNLTFTGSAFYSGGTSMTVPMTVSGTIVGYELINCDSSGSNCSLGPKEFTLHISGQATGQFTMNPDLNSIVGVYSNFTGTATVAPEPISLVLTGTGLVGILIRKKMVRTKQV